MLKLDSKKKSKLNVKKSSGISNGISELSLFSQFLTDELARLLELSKLRQPQEVKSAKQFETIHECINQAIELAKDEAKDKHIYIDLKWQKLILENANKFFFDKNQLKLVLLKILSNAIKHSPEYTTINMKINFEKHETYTDLWPCWNLIVTVTDSGKGFTESQLEKF